MRGAFGKVSKEIKVKPRTCSRIWKRYVDTRSPTISARDIRNRRTNCGRKKKSLIELERIRAIPYEQRGDLRTVAELSNISLSTLWRRLKDGSLKKHNATVKPLLTDRNKLQRMDWVLSHIKPNGLFNDIYQYIQVDEKWVYSKKCKNTYYLLPD